MTFMELIAFVVMPIVLAVGGTILAKMPIRN